MNDDEIVEDFWESLGDNQEFYVEPRVDRHGRYYMSTNDPTDLFSTYFWERFEDRPFSVLGVEKDGDVMTLWWIVDESGSGRVGEPASDLWGDS